MAKVLTTPIAIPNVTRWKCLTVQEFQDAPVPYAIVTVQFTSPGAAGVTYAVFRLNVYDAQDSDTLFANQQPMSSYTDRILKTTQTIPNAYTTIFNANHGAGNRAAQLLLVEAALLTLGVVDATLTGT